MIKRIFQIAIFLFLSSALAAQDVETILKEQMEKAKSEMSEGNYEAANRTFRKILTLNVVLPHEFTYLFAETLYMVGQYENSKNFLDRYFKLTGKAGDYTTQAEELDLLLGRKLISIEECNFCDIKGYRLTTCKRCLGQESVSAQCYYCSGHGGLKCNVCLGEGVLIETNEFDVSEYKTCYNCNGKGKITCPICHGEKSLVQKCPLCLGTGVNSTSTLCDHLPHDHQEN